MKDPVVHQLRFDFDVINARVDFLTGIAFCAELVESSFPDLRKQGRKFHKGQEISIPETLWYDHYDFLVEGVDYLHVTRSFPVMSKQMIEVLDSVKSFDYIAHPVKLRQARPAPDGTGLGAEREFYILNVLRELDIFDWERSEYTPNRIGGLRKVIHAVFHEPSGGLPPFFIEKNMSHCQFVSDEAKQALEAAGIVGVKFWPPKKP